MWVVYGVAILLSSFFGVLLGWDTPWLTVPFAVTVGALPFMIWYHHRLEKRYYKK
jgi:hypothetical protein